MKNWFLKRNLKVAIVLLLAVTAHSVAAQVPHFHHQNLEKKYPGIKVKVLYQDPTGFIWYGTNRGLIQFTGTEYHRYQLADSANAPAVTALHHDAKDNFWIGFDDGTIARFKQETFYRFNPPEGLPKAAITGIAHAKNNILWFSTYGEGIYYYLDDRLYNINTDDGLPDNTVYCITQDQSGQLWAGTDGGIGLCKIVSSAKVVTHLTTEDGLPDNIVRALATDNQGDIWIGMYDGGVTRYETKEKRFTQSLQQEKWQYGPINSLAVFDDEVWAGTQGNGVVIISRQDVRLSHQLRYTDLISARILDILGDAEGNVWISTEYKGIYSASRRFSFLRTLNNKKLQGLHSVLAGNDGSLWFSDSKGLYAFNFKTEELKRWLETDENHFVISLYQDTFGCIWAGTFGNGLYRFDPATGMEKHFDEESGLINNNVLSINGSGQTLWFATLGGVSRAEVSKERNVAFRNFSSREGLGTNYIYQVIIDKDGVAWFGTDGKGLAQFKDGRFRMFEQTRQHEIKSVYSVAEVEKGGIWFSTASKGLFQLKNDSLVVFGLAQGLSDMEITSLINVSGGDLLVLHKSGIDLINGKTLSVQHYGSEAGIGEIDPDLNAFSKDETGNIWMATQEGLLRYHPLEDASWISPQTVINNMLVYLEKTSRANTKLEHDQNYVSFDFTALWYQNPGQVNLQYRLEGYIEEWTTTQDRLVTYPNLPPGHYNFQLRSSTNGDFRQASISNYSFTIHAPFWTQWWFYLLVTLIVGASIYGIIKLREQQLHREQRLEQEKIRFQFETLRSQVNPHFLFNSFNTLISIIEEDKETAVEYVEKLSEFFRNILQYRDQEVIPLREEIELINAYYYLQQKRYGENLKLKIDVHQEDLKKYIPPLTLQLLVENAVKHNIISRSRPLVVEICSTNNHHLTVKNTLQKKRKQETSTGMGLENIRNRYGMLTREEIVIEEGSNSFAVSIPLVEAKPI